MLMAVKFDVNRKRRRKKERLVLGECFTHWMSLKGIQSGMINLWLIWVFLKEKPQKIQFIESMKLWRLKVLHNLRPRTVDIFGLLKFWSNRRWIFYSRISDMFERFFFKKKGVLLMVLFFFFFFYIVLCFKFILLC